VSSVALAVEPRRNGPAFWHRVASRSTGVQRELALFDSMHELYTRECDSGGVNAGRKLLICGA
jgi:hypothetical protein